MTTPDRLLRRSEVQKLVGLSKPTIYRMCKSGDFDLIKPGPDGCYGSECQGCPVCQERRGPTVCFPSYGRGGALQHALTLPGMAVHR